MAIFLALLLCVRIRKKIRSFLLFFFLSFHTAHPTSNTSGHQMGGKSSHTEQFCNTSWTAYSLPQFCPIHLKLPADPSGFALHPTSDASYKTWLPPARPTHQR